MSQLSGSYSTYLSRGQREDLSDVISMITPEDTPFQANAKTDNVEATTFEWLTDTLAAPITTNTVVEGNQASYSAPTAATRLINYVQISEKTVRVTGTLETVAKAGRRSEMGRELMKRTKELKKDVEAASLSNQGADAGSNAAGRKTASLQAFIKTNTIFETAGADPVYTNIPTSGRTDGTPDAFVELDVQTGMLKAYNAGGQPKLLMLTPYHKTVFSTFDGIAQIRKDVPGTEQAVIIGAADIYVSDFGDLSVVPNRVLATARPNDAFLLDPEFMTFVYLRPFHTEVMGKQGDSDDRVARAEWGLKIENEAAHAGLYDLASS